MAMALAERFDGEIVNADSMQVYRYLDIGTAKPSLADRERIPHHVIDVVHPKHGYSAGRYLVDARNAARAIHARGRVVFLTGGTGLYIRAFLHGLLDAGGAEPELRARLEAEDREARLAGDPARLHRRLSELDSELDPEAARRIHPNDARRLVRALELAVHWGTPASRLHAAHRFEEHPYRVLHLALDPGNERLDPRIDARCAEMIERGLLQEVRALRKLGVSPEARCMQAIGYRHMAPVVDGSDTLANAQTAMQRDTRRFARRQRTWLRSVSGVVFFDPADAEAICRAVETFLERRAVESAVASRV
jgi:tRNA dimethylallyltransferase